jgi:hypothetical protein
VPRRRILGGVTGALRSAVISRRHVLLAVKTGVASRPLDRLTSA